MAVYVPNSVISGEAQQTVSRESIRRIVQGQKNTAGSAAEAQVLLESAIAAGVSSVVGFEVIRTDLGVKQYWNGSAWVRLGGQDHGFKGTLFQSNLPKDAYKNLGISTVKQSDGWSLNSTQTGLIIPEDGIYGVRVFIDVNLTASNITRARCRITVNGVEKHRTTVDADDVIALGTMLDVKARDVVTIYYHWSGTGTTAVVESGELLVYRASTPRWI